MVERVERTEGNLETSAETDFIRSLKELDEEALYDAIRDNRYSAEEIEETETFISNQPKLNAARTLEYRDVLWVAFGYAMACQRQRAYAKGIVEKIEHPDIQKYGRMVVRNRAWGVTDSDFLEKD